MEKKDLKSMDLNEVTAFVTELGEKPFRAKRFTSGCTRSWPRPWRI